MKIKSRFVAVIAVAMLALAGCAQASPAKAGDSVTITDSWVKAADSGMSAAFGTLKNSSDKDVTVTAVTSKASSMMQLHETVTNEAGEMVMQEKKGGFVIPAGGSFELAPGANHIMLMDLAKPLVAGETVSFTLKFSDDSTYTFDAPVKDYSGANETYQGGETHGSHDSHDATPEPTQGH